MKDLAYKDFLDELKLSYYYETFSAPHDTEVLWFPENRTLFIRGTDSLTDWIFNLWFFPNEVGFHSGLHEKSRKLYFELSARNIKPETIFGHSAGGAIAQSLGFVFNCEVYSLASPKTTNKTDKKFLEWAEKNLVIIIQESDWISKLPPVWLHHPVDPLVLTNEDYPIFAHRIASFE